MITFKIPGDMEEKIEKALGRMEGKAPDVLKNAINDTAKQARRRITQETQKAYTIKVGGWNQSMKIKRATRSRMEALIHSKGKAVPLIKFQTSAGKGRGAAAKVVRKNSLKPLVLKGGEESGKDLKAFLAKFSSGHRAVVQRVPGRYLKGKSPRRLKSGRKTGGRQALKQLYSNSIPKMAGSEQRVYRMVEPYLAEDLKNNLAKHITKVMEG